MTSAVSRSRILLIDLAKAHHRGPSDTWTAARDRAAKAAGIERSYAARIWHRWRTMDDVSGEAILRLAIAYQELCRKSEAKEAALQADREGIARETAQILASTAGPDLFERMEPASTSSAAHAARAVRGAR